MTYSRGYRGYSTFFAVYSVSFFNMRGGESVASAGCFTQHILQTNQLWFPHDVLLHHRSSENSNRFLCLERQVLFQHKLNYYFLFMNIHIDNLCNFLPKVPQTSSCWFHSLYVDNDRVRLILITADKHNI